MPGSTLRKLTPVLLVDAIEPCLPFWVDRLGFEQTVAIPDGEGLGFVILVRDGLEIMYQTRSSTAKDLGPAFAEPRGHSTTLFIEVADLRAIESALAGIPFAFPRRRTFYGMDEIGVPEPSGALVIFAQPAE